MPFFFSHKYKSFLGPVLRFLFTLIHPALSATDAQRSPLLSVENSEEMVEFWKSFDNAKMGILKYRNTILPFEVHVASFGGWGPFMDDTHGASEIIFDCRIGLMDLLITTLGNVEASTGEALKSIFLDQSILMNDILGKLKSGYQRIHGQGVVAETIINRQGYDELEVIEAELLGNSEGEVASKHQGLLKNHFYRQKYEILLIEKIAELFKENRKLQCEEWENFYCKVYQEQNDNLDKFLSQRKESNAVFLQEIRNEQVETK